MSVHASISVRESNPAQRTPKDGDALKNALQVATNAVERILPETHNRITQFSEATQQGTDYALSSVWPVLTPALVQAATAAIKEVLASQSAWQVSCHSVLLLIFSNCNDAQAKRDALTADLTAIHDAEVKRLQDELATERAGIDAAVAKHLSDFQVKLASISD